MVIEKMPPLGVIKHLRGIFDVYVLHIGGVDKVILRTWPRKSSGYKSDSFIKARQAATLTIQAYRELSNKLKILCNSYHKTLNDQFLDHFRAGVQGGVYSNQAPPNIFTDIEISDAINPPFISIRLYRNFFCRIYLSTNKYPHARYVETVLVRKRGIACEQRHYIRPKDIAWNLFQEAPAGWSNWIDITPTKELSIYSLEPTPANPQKAWFGPFPIQDLLNRYILLG